MSDDIRNSAAAGGENLSAADKLSSAAQTLSDVDAEAKARREEERLDRLMKEKRERELSEALEKQRLEEEKQAREIMRKKQAELEYAENYRKKLREQKARNEALAANRRAAERKAAEERQRKEAEEAAREQLIKQGLAEAERRNAESDSLLLSTSNRVKQKELAAEELKRRIREARDKAEKESAEALLRSLMADDGMSGMVVTAEGIELFPGNEGYDEALTKARAEAEGAEKPEAEALRSESLLAAITAKLADNKDGAASADSVSTADGAPENTNSASGASVPEISEDYILGKSIGTAKADNGQSDAEAKSADTAEGDGADDFIISFGETVHLSGADETYDKGAESDADISAEAPASKESATIGAEASKPEGNAYASGTQGSASGGAYLFSTSTYDMMTADTDFGEDYTEKKRSNEQTLQRYRDTESGEAYSGPAGVTENTSDGDGKRNKKNKSSTPEYKYHAGGVYNSELLTEKVADGKNGEQNAQSGADGKEKNTKNEAAVTANDTAVRTVAAVGASSPVSAKRAEYDEEDARIAKLVEEKSKLEGELRAAEEKNLAEIASLTEKEQSAKRDMLKTEFEIKEAQYRREIEELNARLAELERAHNAKREELEGSILSYETKSTELRKNADNDTKAREREALDKQSAEELNAQSVEALDKNELKNYLNRADSKERRLKTRIDKSRRQYKRARSKGLDPAPSLYEVIRLEGELTESYVISYKHILASDGKQYKGTYKSKIKSLTSQYNKDLADWSALTGANTDTLSKTLADDIAEGKELRAIPKVYLADAEAAVKESASDTESDEKRAIADTASKLTGQEEMRSLGEKELRDYLGKRDKAERRLEGEISDLRKKQKNAKNAKLLKHLKPCIEKEAELLDSYVTDYKYIISSEKQKDKKKYAAKVNTWTEAYNRDLEMWRGLTETPVTLYPTDAVSRMDKGEDAPKPYVISTPDAPKSEKPKEGSAKSEELDELRSEAERTAEQSGLTAISKQDLADYLNRSSGREAKLIRAVTNAERKLRGKKGEGALVALKAVIDAKAELVDFYVETYSATLAVEKTKYVKQYESKLTSAKNSYNKSTKRWRELSDTAAYTVPSTIIKDIKAGKEYGKTPTVDIADKYSYAETVSKGAEKSSEPTAKKSKEKPLITKADMKADIRTVEAKIDYRCDKYGKSIELSEYRYGEQSKKDKRRLNNESSKLRAMKRGKRAVLNAARSDNARYLEAANLKLGENGKSQSKSERAAELQERIRKLLLERKSINERLDSLYAEEELGGKRARGKSYRTRLSEYRLSEVKREFKRQGKNYRKVSKFRVSPARKQSVYDAMNKKIELTGYLAECRYRLKHEKPKAAARKYLKSEISETKKSIKHSNSDIDYYLVKNGKRSAKTPSAKHQLIWLLVLLFIIAAGVAIYLFRAPIFEWVKGVIAQLIPAANP